jgi:hypothetical protein
MLVTNLIAKMSYRILWARAKLKPPNFPARRRLCVAQAHNNTRRYNCSYEKNGHNIGRIWDVQIFLRIRQQFACDYIFVCKQESAFNTNGLGFNEIGKLGTNMCTVQSLQDGSLNPIPVYEIRRFTNVFKEACYCALPSARRFWPPIPP